MMRIKPLANAISVTTANQVSVISKLYAVTTTASTLVSLGPNSSTIAASVVLPAGVYYLEKTNPTDFWTANTSASFTPIATR